MNKLEQQLQSHARRIEARTTPELQARLKRAVAKADLGAAAEPQGLWSPRLAGGLAFAFALAVAVIAWPRISGQSDSVVLMATANQSSPITPVARLGNAVDLQRAPEAELQDEIQRLNADWQRIRNRVRDQIDPLL